MFRLLHGTGSNNPTIVSIMAISAVLIFIHFTKREVDDHGWDTSAFAPNICVFFSFFSNLASIRSLGEWNWFPEQAVATSVFSVIMLDINWDQLLEWAQEDMLRPVLILVCGMLLFNLPTLLYKIRMVFRAFAYFFLCWDKSWKKPQDPGAIFGPHLSQGLPVERKTVYFCRHTESTWNDTFNKGKHRSTLIFVLGFIPGLIKAVLYEIYLLLSGKLDR